MAGEVSVRVELNLAGFSELRKSEAVKADLLRRAQAIADSAGDGFEVFESETPTRARAAVVATTAEAMLAEATTRDLTTAIDAGRA